MAADVSATGVSLLGNLKHHPASRAVMLQFRFIASSTLFPSKMPQLGLRLLLGTARNKIAARPKATRSWELGQGCQTWDFCVAAVVGALQVRVLGTAEYLHCTLKQQIDGNYDL